MRSGMLTVSLSTLSMTGLALGARIALVPLAEVKPGGASGARPRDAVSYAAPRVDLLTQVVVPRDPFRITRRPATVAYDLLRAAQPATPTPPKPALMLTGIVWDAKGNPSAVLDGLPGGGGPRVVRQGDQIGMLRVRHIARDRVVVTGMDTTWALTVREPWR